MNWKTSSCEARGFCFWCLPGVISVYTLPSGLLLHSKVTAVYCLRVYSPMHEVVPSVVAMAVRMVMAMCRIFCQIDFVSMVLEFSFVVSFSGWFVFTTDSTD